MENSTDPRLAQSADSPASSVDAGERLSELSSLLTSLDEAARADGLSANETESQNAHQGKLVSTRLGVASSLYTALRAKHSPTADHSLRVALGCSSWLLSMEVEEAERDLIEIAALLHDVGKIGVPDHVLLKPGSLTGEEVLQMERHRRFGREILLACCPTDDLLDVIYYSNAWFDGSKHGFDREGPDLPLGARMIAIVDAFDAMTTDHIYRRAMSRERATAELFQFAGTQFDPDLVKDFSGLLNRERVQFGAQVARRWLQQICPTGADRFFGLRTTAPRIDETEPEGNEFHTHLLDHMHDGVLYVDSRLKIVFWNQSCERLTGIAAQTVVAKEWSPEMLLMQDERTKPISLEECPILETMQSGVQSVRRVSISHRNGETTSVDMQISPVLGPDGVPRGATVVLHDASSQITLEERVQTLYEKATRDPLTKCANRAEFDRLLPQFVETHLEKSISCSMIMCDIDHFKSINDTYGHQAGDEALTCFGALLRRHARSGDLVARYGGEEFVLLCADCDNATATRRAEELRRNLAAEPQPALGNRNLTASFGVTEIQGGDTAETFLRRADRALLQAKDNGRNIVVQLGIGIGTNDEQPTPRGWFRWFRAATTIEPAMERQLVTVVPMTVAAEKLRGFVADHNAEINKIDGNCVSLKIDEGHAPLMRRWNDRPVPFLIDLTFEEAAARTGSPKGGVARTLVKVVIRPKRQRDRRRRDTSERARQLLLSLKSYLMAQDDAGIESAKQQQDGRETFLRNTKQILSYWLRS